MKEDLKTRIKIFIYKTVIGFYDRFFIITFFFSLLSFVLGCEVRKELLDMEMYEGPIMIMDSVRTQMSDSGILVMTLIAPRQENFENGNREWPKGLNLEYFSNSENPICIFKSNLATYNAQKDLYKGVGNVIVKNVENGDELNTEELFWSPSEEKFYTDKFITIYSDGEIHTGVGITANQDFTSYQIHKPAGTIKVNEEF